MWICLCWSNFSGDGYMEEIWTHLKIGSTCRVENRIYFCNITFNGVFYLDIEDFTIHFVHRFSFAPDYAVRLSKDISLAYNHAIYFFPSYTNVILKYDILEQQEEAIPIPDFHDKLIDVSGIAKRQDMVYIFPAELEKGIYVFDLKKQQVKKDLELSSLFHSGFLCSSGHIFYDHEDCVLIGEYGGNQIVKINLATKRIIANQIVEGMQIFVMCFDGSHYWILPMESTDIYEWDMEKDILQKYTNEYVEWRRADYIGQRPYSNLVFLKDEILVLNCYAKKILRIDKEKKTIGNSVEYPEGFRLVNSQFSDWPVYARYTMLEDKVLLYPYAGNMLLIYDMASKKLVGKDLLVSEKEVPYLRKALKESFMEKSECIEDGDFGILESFADMVEKKNKNRQSRDNRKIGQGIWNSLSIR